MRVAFDEEGGGGGRERAPQRFAARSLFLSLSPLPLRADHRRPLHRKKKLKLTTMSFVGLTLIPILLRIFRRDPSANGGREAGAGAEEAAAAAASSSRAAATAVAADEGIDEIELSGLRPPTLPPPITAVGDSLSAIARDESTCYFV